MRVLPLAVGVAAVSLLVVGRVGAQTPDGKAIYLEQCRQCHGLAGKPTQMALAQYKTIPTFDATFFATRSQDSIVAVLRHGTGKDMKSFKQKLSADEITAVANYVKQTFGSAAAPSH